MVFYAGFMQPLQASQDSGLARALSRDFRLIYADHRGHGRSAEPHDSGAYSLETRVAIAIAVLDDLRLERWLSLAGHTHLSASEEVDAVLPHVLDLFHSVASVAR